MLLCSLFIISTMAFAQTGSISGKVVDETNQPLPSATVQIQGTQKVTNTDINGNYKLTGLVNGKVTLEIRFVGYQTLTQVVNVAGSTVVNVGLKLASSALNEVVVIGYGTTNKKDLTGSVATVTSKDFNTGAVTSPEQLIQGKVAGVSITSNSGAPGSGSTIRIRGGASINGSNAPLIIIDGVPLSPDGIGGVASPLDMINPNDVESFSILKDASAAAIYGNRASNGVIIITTKKGEKAKVKVTEVTPTDIKYKLFDDEGEPSKTVYTISKSDVTMIVYKDGRKETFNANKPTSQSPLSGSKIVAEDSKPITNTESQTIKSAEPVSKLDRMFLHNGTVISGKVFKVDNYTIIYMYDGEQTQQVISKYAVEKIIYSGSGRIEKVSDKITVANKDDWERVVILEDKSYITGLQKVDEIIGKSRSGYYNLAKRDSKAERRIKESAAEMGCPFILYEAGLNGYYQAVRKGIAYKY